MLPSRIKNRSFKEGRWINPFIPKLSEHTDSIVSPESEDLEPVRQRLIAKSKNYSSTYLELCSGSGTHLLALAQQNPETLIIGVELRFKRIVRTAEKAKEQSLDNLLLLQFNAEYINDIIPANSLQRIYINFPDPWDSKLRWHDRFLLSEKYLKTLHSLLKTGGRFAFKTDHQMRFNQVHSIIENMPDFFRLTEVTNDLHSSDYKNQNIFTEFERLFSQQKKPVFYLMAQK